MFMLAVMGVVVAVGGWCVVVWMVVGDEWDCSGDGGSGSGCW